MTVIHRETVERKTKVENMRGNRLSIKFGSYVERGRSEATWTVKERDYCSNFLQDKILSQQSFQAHVPRNRVQSI
jgi:hypothetical protein